MIRRKTKTRLLDLFCGAGGAAVGYHRAGFDVVGVDHRPQPRYPFEFVQADAMTFPLDGFDVIHASPPCQRYSIASRNIGRSHGKPDLIPAVRHRLTEQGAPWVIENVYGAPLFFPVLLCGSMFGLGSSTGLWLRRHRLFECSHLFLAPQCRHPKAYACKVYGNGTMYVGRETNRKCRISIGVYGNETNRWHQEQLGRNITITEQREAMGIDWMTRAELTQAIPPAYTEWIGKRLMETIQ